MADHTDPQRGSTRTKRLAAVSAWLRRLPLTGVFLGALVVGLVALLWPGPVGGVLVLVVAAAVAAILTVAWSRHTPGTRAVRLAILGMLIVIAMTKFS